jgi:hypothetical protein
MQEEAMTGLEGIIEMKENLIWENTKTIAKLMQGECT